MKGLVLFEFGHVSVLLCEHYGATGGGSTYCLDDLRRSRDGIFRGTGSSRSHWRTGIDHCGNQAVLGNHSEPGIQALGRTRTEQAANAGCGGLTGHLVGRGIRVHVHCRGQ